MKAIALFAMCLLAIAMEAAQPEKGPYAPQLSSDYLGADGELYPSAIGVRPWKSEDPTTYGGEYTDMANPALGVKLRINKDKDGTWTAGGEWKLKDLREHPRVVSWTRASMELESKHTYAHAGRGTLFVFFVQYRDPGAKGGEPTPAVMIGDHLFAKK